MLAVGAGGGCLDIFSLICHFSFLSPSLWETARYRLKYCLEGPLNPKQPTNQPCFIDSNYRDLALLLKVYYRSVVFVPKCVLFFGVRVGQGPTALAVGAGGRYFGHFFSRLSFLFSVSLSLARYRLKYCLKGPLSPKQPTN